MEEESISVLEQGSSTLILEGLSKTGHVYTIGLRDSGMIAIYKIEVEAVGAQESLICYI